MYFKSIDVITILLSVILNNALLLSVEMPKAFQLSVIPLNVKCCQMLSNAVKMLSNAVFGSHSVEFDSELSFW